jgi:hypothetical protein
MLLVMWLYQTVYIRHVHDIFPFFWTSMGNHPLQGVLIGFKHMPGNERRIRSQMGLHHLNFQLQLRHIIFHRNTIHHHRTHSRSACTWQTLRDQVVLPKFLLSLIQNQSKLVQLSIYLSYSFLLCPLSLIHLNQLSLKSSGLRIGLIRLCHRQYSVTGVRLDMLMKVAHKICHGLIIFQGGSNDAPHVHVGHPRYVFSSTQI